MANRPKPPNRSAALNNRLTDADLARLRAQAEVQLAALEPAGALLPLEALDDDQLQSLIEAKSREEVHAFERQFAAGRQPQRPRQKVKVIR
jgi:hypothetical protein